MLETFVDPQRFQGTVYRAANWLYLGLTRGYRRTRQGYSNTVHSPKKVFVKPLQSNARSLLGRPVLPFPYRQGVPKMMLSAQQMRSLPDFFIDIPDPRRPQGRRHCLPTVLAIACGAILCGMRGYKAMADWAQSLGPKARERFGCRRVNGRYLVPSESIIREARSADGDTQGVDDIAFGLGHDFGWYISGFGASQENGDAFGGCRHSFLPSGKKNLPVVFRMLLEKLRLRDIGWNDFDGVELLLNGVGDSFTRRDFEELAGEIIPLDLFRQHVIDVELRGVWMGGAGGYTHQVQTGHSGVGSMPIDGRSR